MKYDLRAALRLFVPLWLGLLVLSIVNRFTFAARGAAGAGNYYTSGIFLLVYTLAVMGIAIAAFIYVLQRFYQGLAKDEAYLTFTLPLSVDSVLWSKALMGLILMMVTGIVCVVSLLIIVVTTEGDHLSGIHWQMILEHLMSTEIMQTILQFGVTFLASCLAEFFLIFLSIGIGQLFQRHRFAAMIGAYVGINTLLSLVAFVMTPTLAKLQAQNNYTAALESSGGMATGLLLSLIPGAVYYLLARWLFKKKLNLE